MERYAKINRITNETSVSVEIDLDNKFKSSINTSIGFLDHMLNLLSFHSKISMRISAKGDLDVCDHHTVEDIGITLGKAFKEAIGDKIGINRYGSFYVPMDETLGFVSLDISNRPFLVYDCKLKREKIGEMATENVEEFFRAFAFNAGITLHLKVLYGNNDHHKVEALFKALGRSLRAAICMNDKNIVASTKGIL